MSDTIPRLILIDGLPGAGKSTTGELLSAAISASGQPSELYLETQPNHPLHVFPTDELGAAWTNIHLKTTPETFGQRSLELWDTFLAQNTGVVSIIESFPFQSSIRVLMQMNQSSELIENYWNEWQHRVARLDAVLLFFHETDPISLIEQAFEERGDQWTSYIVRSFELMPYCKTRGLTGKEATIGFLRDYAELLDHLMSNIQIRAVTFEARPENYEERQMLVYQAFGLNA